MSFFSVTVKTLKWCKWLSLKWYCHLSDMFLFTCRMPAASPVSINKTLWSLGSLQPRQFKHGWTESGQRPLVTHWRCSIPPIILWAGLKFPLAIFYWLSPLKSREWSVCMCVCAAHCWVGLFSKATVEILLRRLNCDWRAGWGVSGTASCSETPFLTIFLILRKW